MSVCSCSIFLAREQVSRGKLICHQQQSFEPSWSETNTNLFRVKDLICHPVLPNVDCAVNFHHHISTQRKDVIKFQSLQHQIGFMHQFILMLLNVFHLVKGDQYFVARSFVFILLCLLRTQMSGDSDIVTIMEADIVYYNLLVFSNLTKQFL